MRCSHFARMCQVLASAYTVGMLSIVSEFMRPQIHLDWKQTNALDTAYTLGTSLAVILWIFIPKLVSLPINRQSA